MQYHFIKDIWHDQNKHKQSIHKLLRSLECFKSMAGTNAGNFNKMHKGLYLGFDIHGKAYCDQIIYG